MMLSQLQTILNMALQLMFGEDKTLTTSIARRLRAGQIHINYGSGGPDAPFGGYKQSGNGREKAEWGLEEFLEVKAIVGA